MFVFFFNFFYVIHIHCTQFLFAVYFMYLFTFNDNGRHGRHISNPQSFLPHIFHVGVTCFHPNIMTDERRQKITHTCEEIRKIIMLTVRFYMYFVWIFFSVVISSLAFIGHFLDWNVWIGMEDASILMIASYVLSSALADSLVLSLPLSFCHI